MLRSRLVAAVAAAVLLQGCSSRPRTFTPMVAPPPAGAVAFDQAAFDRAYVECNDLMVAGKLDSSGRVASAGAGAATGAGVAVAGGALAASTVPAAGIALASATVVLLPFAVIGGAVGMAKAKRARKEKAIKAAMTGCLHERGYEIVRWDRATKSGGATAALAR